jgi:Raf kinase inhibitor-like YbhB/YbcL family protein
MHQKILIVSLSAAFFALALCLGCHFFGENDKCDIETETVQDDDDANDDANDDADDDIDDDDDADDDVDDDTDDDTDDNSTRPGYFRLLSPAFAEGDMIPPTYTCDTNDPDLANGASPPLVWIYSPGATQSLAVVMTNTSVDDRVHWAIVNIPPNIQFLEEALSPASLALPGSSWEAGNDFDTQGYRGPCPPVGVFNFYRFTILSLDRLIEKPPNPPYTYNAIAQQLEDATIEDAAIDVFYQH